MLAVHSQTAAQSAPTRHYLKDKFNVDMVVDHCSEAALLQRLLSLSCVHLPPPPALGASEPRRLLFFTARTDPKAVSRLLPQLKELCDVTETSSATDACAALDAEEGGFTAVLCKLGSSENKGLNVLQSAVAHRQASEGQSCTPLVIVHSATAASHPPTVHSLHQEGVDLVCSHADEEAMLLLLRSWMCS